MANTPAQQQAAVAADTRALAALDLATLQTAYNAVQAGNISINVMITQLTNMANALGDPVRQQQAQTLLSVWQTNFVGQLATMLSQANAAAGN